MITAIGIRNLRVDCIIGVRDRERDEAQPVFIDVSLEGDLSAAAVSEHVEDTVDYSRVAESLMELARVRRFRLLEAFAAEAGSVLLEQNPRVHAVRLEIRKPEAIPQADFAYVRYEASRQAKT